MSDLLTTNPSPTADQSAQRVGTPLPPPPPASPDDGTGRRRILAIIGGLALLVAVIMGLLWMTAQSDRDSALEERDAAQAASVAESDRTEEVLSELADARIELDAAAATAERLAAETEAAEAATTDAVARADATTAATAALEVQNDELTKQVATLESSLIGAETEAADAVAEAEAAVEAATDTAAVTPEATAFDIAAAADFARFIGERLASVERSSVLGQGQHTCLGTAVVNDIGLDAIGVGLEDGAASSASSAVNDAIERGAISCGIDPSAIF